MKGYTTREVAEVLGLPTSTILAWTRSGLLTPSRGPRGAYQYSFQDIVLLRAARGLLDAEVPARRVKRALRTLREQLPLGRPLSAVQISSLGDRVLVRDADSVWEPDSGQLQMDFSVAEVAERVRPVARRVLAEGRIDQEAMTADDWYDTGVDLEAVSLDEAKHAYRNALAVDPGHAEAHLNLGRILHEEGDVPGAEAAYREAICGNPSSARAFYNLGVALEDQNDPGRAIAAYDAAIELDPGLAVAHFNLSRLHEEAGREPDALSHLAAYKRLLDKGDPSV